MCWCGDLIYRPIRSGRLFDRVGSSAPALSHLLETGSCAKHIFGSLAARSYGPTSGARSISGRDGRSRTPQSDRKLTFGGNVSKGWWAQRVVATLSVNISAGVRCLRVKGLLVAASGRLALARNRRYADIPNFARSGVSDALVPFQCFDCFGATSRALMSIIDL